MEGEESFCRKINGGMALEQDFRKQDLEKNGFLNALNGLFLFLL